MRKRPKTPCITLQEQRCLHSYAPVSFALRQHGAHLSIQSVPNTHISYPLCIYSDTHINIQNFGSAGSTVSFLGDVGSLEHHLLPIYRDQCDIVFQRRLNHDQKKTKRRFNRIYRSHRTFLGAIFTDQVSLC